jgi:hypothetical protein
MSPMRAPTQRTSAGLEDRVQRTLERCLDWSQQGRHRKVLTEVERLLRLVRNDRQLQAQLLIW